MQHSIKKNYLTHIDGLRGVAVLAVLLFHLGIPLFSGGYVGVDIFFVISGFLITGILKDELDKDGTLNFKRFYSRRIRRLSPALIIVSIATFTFAALVFSPNHLQRIGAGVSTALLNVSNIFFWFEADYFDTSAKLKPFLHTWSLSVEWQFYLVMPFTIFILYKLSLRKLFFPFILFSSVISLYLNFKFAYGQVTLLNIYFPYFSESLRDGKSTIFFLTFFRVFEFGIGGLLLWILPLKLKYRFLYDILLWTGLSLILYTILKFSDAMLFPYWFAVLPCVGASLIIYSGDKAYSAIIINNKFLITVGLLSYSIYLTHWPIIVFWHYLSNSFELTQQILASLLSFTLSVILYKCIEKPLRIRYISGKGWAWTGIGLSFIVLLAAGFHTYKHQGWKWRIDESIIKFEEVNSTQGFHKKYYGGSGYPYYGSVNTELPPDLIILGDSYGRQYAEGLYKVVAAPNDLSLYIASGTSCFHLPSFTRTTEGVDWNKLCPKQLEIALSYIKSAPQPPLVIISHAWDYQMGVADLLDTEGKRRGIKVTVTELIEGLAELKEKIGDAPLLVIGNTPEAGTNLYDIFTRPKLFSDFNHEEYLFRRRNSLIEKTNKTLMKYANETGLYTFINPFDYLCDSKKCQNTDQYNHLIYSDSGHLSKYGSIFMIDKIKNDILQNIHN